MRAFWNCVSIAWCRIFHPAPCWPVGGRYECPACFRAYPVPWHLAKNSTHSEIPKMRGSSCPGMVLLEFQKEGN